jgi:putative phosphoribosyl transferase
LRGRLVLAVTPGTAGAFLVAALAARNADHVTLCRAASFAKTRGACFTNYGYIRSMIEESGAGPDRETGYQLPFPDRRAAGRLLGERLKATAALQDWAERTVVLGLPRGGVAVAKQVAEVLDAPMDVIVTRKIGYPPQPELGVGAMAENVGAPGPGPGPGEGDVAAPPVFDTGLLARLSLSPTDLAGVVAAEEAELARRVRVYRGGRPLPPVAGRCVIVVDDGLATGVTARAALRSLRAAQPAYLMLAVPVAPPSAAQAMRAEADQVITLATPSRFSSVGEWYLSFGQLTDADVLALLV